MLLVPSLSQEVTYAADGMLWEGQEPDDRALVAVVVDDVGIKVALNAAGLRYHVQQHGRSATLRDPAHKAPPNIRLWEARIEASVRKHVEHLQRAASHDARARLLE